MSVDQRIEDLLLCWEELRERGQQVSPEELCRDCPELVEELRRRIQALESLDPALDVTSSSTTGIYAPDKGRTLPEGSKPNPLSTRALAGYEILGELGRGGMGVVYKARQVSLDRIVALKVILAGEHAAPHQRDRFRGEAEASARLQHPNIVQVYEVGEQDRCLFFSLEYIDGGSLHDVLLEREQPPLQAAELVEQLARAVDYANQRGIIHRDLKPGNILLTKDGTPKIADFGLAKRLGGGPVHTRTGDVIGTPSYMAPEQAAGKTKEIGPATDVYSLGAILYELLAGRPPFEGTTAFDTVHMVLTAEPERPSRRNPRVPRDLETICLKCLEKLPAKRYASALDLADDLRRFQRGEPIEARRVGRLERGVKWVRRRPAVSALLAICAVSLLTLLIGGWVSRYRLSLVNKKIHEDLVRLHVSNGTNYLRDGDLMSSLIWFAQALKEEKNNNRMEAHFVRFAAVLHACPQLSQLWFHKDDANDIAFSPNGDWVLTASSDGTAQVWDAATGAARFEPLRHDSPILVASFSPDGKRIVTADESGAAQVWDAETGQPIAPLKGHTDAIREAHFSPDGRKVITAGDDSTARIWNTVTGKQLYLLEHRDAVVQALFHPKDGSRVLTASRDKSARLWQLETETARPVHELSHSSRFTDACFNEDGELAAISDEEGATQVWEVAAWKKLPSPLAHQGAVQRVVFSPDSKLLATASTDLTVWVCDTKTGRAVLPQLRHLSRITSVVFSPHGKRLLTSSDDNTARVWDAANGRPLTPPLPHNGTVHRAVFSPDGRRIATVAADSTARVYDLAPGEQPVPPLRHGGRLRQASFDAEGRRVVTAGSDGAARIWDANTGANLAVLRGHASDVLCASFNKEGDRIVTAGADNTARIWDAATAQTLVTLRGHQKKVCAASFSPEGRRVLTASDDKTARIWDARTGKVLVELGRTESGPRLELLDAEFSPDGTRVGTASADGTARLWDAKNGVQIGETMRHKRSVTGLAFSRDGLRLATCSYDQTAEIWDAFTGVRLLQSPLRHPGPLRDVCFSSDGNTLLTTGEDNSARLWDIASGKLLRPPMRHNGTISMARFSRDGKWVVTASDDNTARVWDTESGDPLTPSLTHRGWGRITWAVFSPTADRVLTASEDGTAQIWELHDHDRPPEELQHLAELLSGTRIEDDSGSRAPLDALELQRLWDEHRKHLAASFKKE